MEIPRGGHWRNWVGNQSFVASHMAAPSSEEELAALMKEATGQGLNVRCAGSGHSFTPIVATSGMLLSLKDYQGVLHVDRGANRVTVAAGTKISAITQHLKQAGFSLINQGDIDSQAIAGALATGTHGTGTTLGNLSSQVVGMRIVRPDGSILEVSDRTDVELLHATQVNLGLFGVVSQITLQVMDSYNLHERIWREDFDACMEMHDELAAKHRHFGFFWCPKSESRHLYCLPDTSQASNSAKDYDVCEVKVMDIT
jgi:FAD/FMN-containing dehydrogenase